MKRIVCAALCVAMLAGIALMGEPSHTQNVLLAGGSGLTMLGMVASFGNVDTLSNVPALLVGTREPVSRNITLLSGESRLRGAVLGKINVGAATSAAKSGGNTGGGTLTMDVTTPVRAGAKSGVYQVRFTAAATNNGTIRVTDPDGFQLGEVVMAAGAGAFDNDIKFAVADVGTDFIVGDGFDITVAAGSGKYKLSVAAAVDGSAVPAVILAEDCDATLADKVTVAYFAATVDENALTYGAGHTAATCREPLRDVGIYLQASIA